MNKKFFIEVGTQIAVVVIGMLIATALINKVEPISNITKKQS